MTKKRYSHLLKDKNIRRWHDNVARGSLITADIYLRRLGGFCESFRVAHNELARMSDKRIYNLLLDFVTEMEKRGCAGSYIESILKAVKSWLAFNDREIKRKIKIKGARDTPSLENERIPTKEELRRIFLAGDEKARATCALVAHSGLRIGVIGDYQGKNGLLLKDFPELKISDGKAWLEKIPTLIKVRKDLSKAGHQYFTFLSQEGCEYLREYLESRMRRGEMLSGDSPLINPKVAKKNFIRAINIADVMRKAIRKAGFPWRPYVLRSYFDTQLMLAESKGLVLRDYRQFWMGHKGDIEAHYTLNKQKLPSEVIEEMRESYRKAQKYLQTIELEEGSDVRKELKKQLMLVAGFKPSEIKEEYLELPDEEFQKLMKGRLLGMNNGTVQKLVHLDDVGNYLQDGWEFVAMLPNNRAILKASS
jgi:hypothetical protein